MIVRPYIALDLCSLKIQAAQSQMDNIKADPAYARAVSLDGYTFTAEHEETILGCAGVIPQWRGRAIAWALLSDEARQLRLMSQITKVVVHFLDEMAKEFWRIETAVKADWPPGAKWAERL